MKVGLDEVFDKLLVVKISGGLQSLDDPVDAGGVSA
jgi:hypothetical protein